MQTYKALDVLFRSLKNLVDKKIESIFLLNTKYFSHDGVRMGGRRQLSIDI